MSTDDILSAAEIAELRERATWSRHVAPTLAEVRAVLDSHEALRAAHAQAAADAQETERLLSIAMRQRDDAEAALLPLRAAHAQAAAERDMLRGVIDTYSPDEPCPPTGHWVHCGESGTTVCGHPACHLRRLLYAARAARGKDGGNGE